MHPAQIVRNPMCSRQPIISGSTANNQLNAAQRALQAAWLITGSLVEMHATHNRSLCDGGGRVTRSSLVPTAPSAAVARATHGPMATGGVATAGKRAPASSPPGPEAGLPHPRSLLPAHGMGGGAMRNPVARGSERDTAGRPAKGQSSSQAVCKPPNGQNASARAAKASILAIIRLSKEAPSPTHAKAGRVSPSAATAAPSPSPALSFSAGPPTLTALDSASVAAAAALHAEEELYRHIDVIKRCNLFQYVPPLGDNDRLSLRQEQLLAPWGAPLGVPTHPAASHREGSPSSSDEGRSPPPMLKSRPVDALSLLWALCVLQRYDSQLVPALVRHVLDERVLPDLDLRQLGSLLASMQGLGHNLDSQEERHALVLASASAMAAAAAAATAGTTEPTTAPCPAPTFLPGRRAAAISGGQRVSPAKARGPEAVATAAGGGVRLQGGVTTQRRPPFGTPGSGLGITNSASSTHEKCTNGAASATSTRENCRQALRVARGLAFLQSAPSSDTFSDASNAFGPVASSSSAPHGRLLLHGASGAAWLAAFEAATLAGLPAADPWDLAPGADALAELVPPASRKPTVTGSSSTAAALSSTWLQALADRTADMLCPRPSSEAAAPRRQAPSSGGSQAGGRAPSLGPRVSAADGRSGQQQQRGPVPSRIPTPPSPAPATLQHLVQLATAAARLACPPIDAVRLVQCTAPGGRVAAAGLWNLPPAQLADLAWALTELGLRSSIAAAAAATTVVMDGRAELLPAEGDRGLTPSAGPAAALSSYPRSRAASNEATSGLVAAFPAATAAAAGSAHIGRSPDGGAVGAAVVEDECVWARTLLEASHVGLVSMQPTQLVRCLQVRLDKALP